VRRRLVLARPDRDGGLTAIFPAYDGDFAPGSLELRFVDAGVVGTFETVLAGSDGGPATPLAGSFVARSCPQAHADLDL